MLILPVKSPNGILSGGFMVNVISVEPPDGILSIVDGDVNRTTLFAGK
jgi:hypothetical protein